MYRFEPHQAFLPAFLMFFWFFYRKCPFNKKNDVKFLYTENIATHTHGGLYYIVPTGLGLHRFFFFFVFVVNPHKCLMICIVFMC